MVHDPLRGTAKEAYRVHFPLEGKMYKVTIQEMGPRESPTEVRYWETVHEMTSHDQVVIASTLRAIANQYDPPRPAIGPERKLTWGNPKQPG